MLSDVLISDYKQHGVVRLLGCVSPQWVNLLRAAVEEDLCDPGLNAYHYAAENAQGRFYGNFKLWQTNPTFQKFCLDPSLPMIAAQLLQSKRVQLYFDHLFVKEPGSRTRTRWHNDQPYWPISGSQLLTVWIALDRVTLTTGALEFIRGSHLWGRWFQPEVFATVSGVEPYQHNADYEVIPDFEKMRDQYDIVSWDLQPGDACVFHGLTVHGAAGNFSAEIRRRGYAVRYAGDDILYTDRLGVNRALRCVKQKEGAPLDFSAHPIVYGQ